MSDAPPRIIICAGTGCMANGAADVRDAFEAALNGPGQSAADVKLTTSGCQGFCAMGPLVTILPQNILYTKVTADDVPEVVAETVQEGRVVERLLYRDPRTDQMCVGPDEIAFYNRQERRILADCGMIDPEDLAEYRDNRGYEAARQAYCDMTPEEVCQVVLESGLRGRGGGGFPTGRKWQLTLKEDGPGKVVICNGDEGDPGAFMDRSLMEGNPHRVLEGMMVAARAVEANHMILYVRAEYPLAVERLRTAVEAARAAGLLGDNVFGTGLALECEVMEGAGAFVCGEETALIASVEGRRGMPRPKPPFPAQSGLNGRPTVINNVETLATVPMIILDGAAAFRSVGTASSPGTKTFAITGHVANTGLIEVPMGTTLREVVYAVGGGVTDDQGNLADDGFKAVQIGGPSGGCLTKAHLDLPLDYDNLQQAGAMIGSGGLVVMNQSTCIVSVARFFMQFTQNESCGKCVPCREGTKQLLALLDDVIEGRADETTLPLLERLAHTVRKASLCGLGKTAPNPVLSTLTHFRKEYEAHVLDRLCPAGECSALTRPAVDPDKCRGCTACARKCPVDAISGKVKEPFTIDAEKCVRCGVCAEICKFDAITGV